MNRAKKIAVKKVTNWITQEYIQKRNEVEAAGGRVSDGFLGELIKQAIANHEMLDESFSVSKQTINARKKKTRPTVWHPGTRSPVEAAEPILVSMITKAHKLNAPWTVGQCKAAMNELIKGTKIEADIIAQRIKDRCYLGSKLQRNSGRNFGFGRNFRNFGPGVTEILFVRFSLLRCSSKCVIFKGLFYTTPPLRTVSRPIGEGLSIVF
jgi:hypothetical protein